MADISLHSSWISATASAVASRPGRGGDDAHCATCVPFVSHSVM